MNLTVKEIGRKDKFQNASKVEQAEYLAWLINLIEKKPVSVTEISDSFDKLGLPRPNNSRIQAQLRKRANLRSGGKGSFLPHANFSAYCQQEFLTLLEVEITFNPDHLKRPPHLSSAVSDGLSVMLEFYSYLFLLENSIRGFIDKTLKAVKGDAWWDTTASSSMKSKHADRQKKEAERKWAPARGSFGPLYSIDWPDLLTIIRKEHSHFADVLPDLGFLHRFEELGHYRNVVAHHGVIADDTALPRLKIFYTDWLKQIG